MFLDIAIGVVLGFGAQAVATADVPGGFVAWGIVFALLPDADFLVHRALFRRDAMFDYRHRELLHRPLLYVPLGAALVWWLSGSAPLAGLFAIASLWHFLHDSTGVGYGVQWLWPFAPHYIGLWHGGLAWVAGHKPVTFLRAVPRATVDAFVRARHRERQRDITAPRISWIRTTYGRLSPTSILEYGALLGVTVIVACLLARYAM